MLPGPLGSSGQARLRDTEIELTAAMMTMKDFGFA